MREAIVWVDAEFSGKNVEVDELLEIAGIVTDMQGKVIGGHYQSTVYIKDLPTVISKSNSIVKDMHEKSGLWSDLWQLPSKTTDVIDREMVKWLSSIVEQKTQVYLGGNSVTTDRNFIAANLSEFDSKVSFRSIDATTLSIVLASNTDFPKFLKNPKHRALEDVKESILEYQHYVKWMSLFNFDSISLSK